MEPEHREPLLNDNIPPATESEPRNRKSTYHGLTIAGHDSKYGRLPKAVLSPCERLRRYSASVCGVQWILRRFPVIEFIRTYKFKEYIIGDIMSGLSVGVVTIPQCLGYAKLADVPVILGLYTSFFPVLIYFMFGSARHVSLGTMALNSLVIAESIRKQEFSFAPVSTNTTSDFNASEPTSGFTPEDMAKISMAINMSFLAGIIQIFMSICQLGCIVSYMAEAFVSGYLAASCLRILTVQVRDMLGIPPSKGYAGHGEYFYNVYHIARNLPSSNLMQILISVASLVALIVVKKCVNERFRSKLKIPIPIDIVLVIVVTLGSYLGRLEERFGVKILKVVPRGIPAITVPTAMPTPDLLFDSFMLALVAYMLVGMMATLFGQRHNYTVDNNQELLATGLSTVAGSFVCCMASSASAARCFLMEMTGGRSQVAFIVAGLLALLAMLAVAPLFEPLPICVLSCIIFVACMPLFPNFTACIGYWRTNKYDFAIWAVTAVVNLIIGVDLGLLVGIGFSLIVVNFRLTQPEASRLEVNESDQICLDQKRYSSCGRNQRVAIFRFESPLYFATLDVFKERLSRKTISLSFLKSQVAVEDAVNGLSLPEVVVKEANNIPLEDADGKSKPQLESTAEENSNHVLQKSPSVELQDNKSNENHAKNNNTLKQVHDVSGGAKKSNPECLIVDCSAVSFLDTSGAKLLAALHGEYSNFKIRFVLAHCCNGVVEQLKKVKACKGLVAESVYPTIQDVLVAFDL